MKNKIIIGLILVIGVFLTSCFEDLGNYDYTSNEVITIGGDIKKDYSVVQFTSKLTIRPEVSSNIPGAEFEYAYWVYDKDQGSQVPDTLLVGKKYLEEYVVGLPSKTYKLIFQAKNVKTGIQGFWEATLNVTTTSNHGWYILKSEDGKCDMDYYNMAGEKAENVLLASCGRQLEGDQAERITVGTNYADPEDLDPKTNTFRKTTVLFPVSNRDAKAVRLSTGKIINDFPEMFQEEPAEPYAPGMAFATSMAQFILNQGKVYYFWPYTSALSKFSVELARNETFDPYRISKYMMYATPNPIGFDEVSTSFVAIPGNRTTLISMTDMPGTELSANHTQMNLLWAGSKGLYDIEHYAVMQEQQDPSRKFIAYITCLGNSMTIKRDNLESTDPAYGASLFTLNHSSSQILYFVNGHELWSRSIAAVPGVNSKLEVVLPEGEIVFIKHMPYSVYGKPEESFDYLLIGAVKDGNYEVVGYTLDAVGRPADPEPALHFAGKGKVGDVTFVFPNVSGTTFVPSY